MAKVVPSKIENQIDQNKMQKISPVLGGLLVLLLISAGSAVYFYRQLSSLKENPQAIAQKEAEALVVKVGKLIVLPEGETPTLATVSDPEALKGQPFFANAKKGDKVLIYTNARKAILYSPESNKIVEVAPVNIGAPQAQPAQPPAQSTESKPTQPKPTQGQPKAQ